MDEEKQTPPAFEGDIIEDQKVINSGKKGDGVVKYENYIFFVNDCSENDIVSFKVKKILPNFGIGEKIINGDEE